MRENKAKTMLSLYNQGMTLRDIAKEFGCSCQNVRSTLYRNFKEDYLKIKSTRSLLFGKKNKIICHQCNREFLSYKNRYCSVDCFRLSNKAKKDGESRREYDARRKREAYANNSHIRERIKNYNKKRYREEKEKAYARSIINFKINTGKIIKPNFCSICGIGNSKTTRIEAHHGDYSKPLDVDWLCSPCHKNIHMSADRLS